MEVVPQWALSSARRLNDVARGPTTSELGTFIENESHVYAATEEHSFSHNAPVKNNTCSFFSLFSSPLSLSLSRKNIRSQVVPIIKIPETYRDRNDKAKTGFKYFTNGETNDVQIEILSLIRANKKWISNGA